MRKGIINIVLILFCGSSFIFNAAYCQDSTNTKNLKVIIIRHAEKPVKGDNLTCQGINRSLELPGLLSSKFGIPDYIYVPSLGLGQSTKHSRMFQTVIPLAAKYNLSINSKYDEKDSSGIANDIKTKQGTVLIVWEHHAIPPIVAALGVSDYNLVWDDTDFDSIWIITFSNGMVTLTKDKEGLMPPVGCPY
jgi:hypothetical protein